MRINDVNSNINRLRDTPDGIDSDEEEFVGFNPCIIYPHHGTE